MFEFSREKNYLKEYYQQFEPYLQNYFVETFGSSNDDSFGMTEWTFFWIMTCFWIISALAVGTILWNQCLTPAIKNMLNNNNNKGNLKLINFLGIVFLVRIMWGFPTI